MIRHRKCAATDAQKADSLCSSSVLLGVSLARRLGMRNLLFRVAARLPALGVACVTGGGSQEVEIVGVSKSSLRLWATTSLQNKPLVKIDDAHEGPVYALTWNADLVATGSVKAKSESSDNKQSTVKVWAMDAKSIARAIARLGAKRRVSAVHAGPARELAAEIGQTCFGLKRTSEQSFFRV